MCFAQWVLLAIRLDDFPSLPMTSLDKMALQRRLDEIGRNVPKAG